MKEIVLKKIMGYHNTLILAPQKAVPRKMSTPALPKTPLFFISECFSILEMVLFAKKIEFNTLRFDRDMRVLSSKKLL